MGQFEVSDIPLIDITALKIVGNARSQTVKKLNEACQQHGFFYLARHGVDKTLQQRLETLSRKFFQQDQAEKMTIQMAKGGRAWRGYFPVGDELTSGRPDLKEGLYFGKELSADHPDVQRGLPLHGPNLFPAIAGFRETVLTYIDQLTQLGHVVMEALARGLGLEPDYFRTRYTNDPLILFRIFHYPPVGEAETQGLATDSWGVGEHTDYGLLTILKQDDVGGLQIKSPGRWLEAPVIPDTFVCNIGDMLERMTGGRYQSTPHRVRNQSPKSRLSFPFFFDPNFHASINPIFSSADINEPSERWDGASVHDFAGTYGDYLLQKVGKVFPDLQKKALKENDF
jgi:isopenicillin N synthase-like dioxygenase